MFKILLMISNYFHDLATALMATNIIVVYFLGKFLDNNPNKATAMADVFKKLSKITYGAFAYIIVFGGVRAYYFMDFEWNPAVGKGQVTALVIKHILLVTLTVIGLIVHTKYRKKYGTK